MASYSFISLFLLYNRSITLSALILTGSGRWQRRNFLLTRKIHFKWKKEKRYWITTDHQHSTYSTKLQLNTSKHVWGHTGGGSVIVIIRRKSVCRPCKHSQRWQMHRSLVRNTKVETISEEKGVWGHIFISKSEGKGQTILPYLAVLKDRVLQYKQTNKTNKQHVQTKAQNQDHWVSAEVWWTNQRKWKWPYI